MTHLVILGAGGHGAVVAEAAVLSKVWASVSFLDDRSNIDNLVVGCPVIGKTTGVAELVDDDRQFFVAFGKNQQRDEILSAIEGQGGLLASVVHPGAAISPSTTIDPGSLVCAGAVINARVFVGRGSIVNTSASIDHDCVLGRAVHISPGANVAGGVSIGDNSWIGIGAAVKDGISIGFDCIVGAGAAVVADVESGQTVVGVPAHPFISS